MKRGVRVRCIYKKKNKEILTPPTLLNSKAEYDLCNVSEDASVHTETPTNVLNGVDCFSTTVVFDSLREGELIVSLVDVMSKKSKRSKSFSECFRNSPRW